MKFLPVIILALISTSLAKPLEEVAKEVVKEGEAKPVEPIKENEAVANVEVKKDDSLLNAEQDKPEAREEQAYEQKLQEFKARDPSSVRQFALTIPELSQTHFQSFDKSGSYSFGYAYPEQVHMESREGDAVNGAYFYSDPMGKQNQVYYTADNNGFQVKANNLPIFSPGHLPPPIRDTPEVEAAKNEHMKIWSAIAGYYQSQGIVQATGPLNPSKPVEQPAVLEEQVVPSNDNTKPTDDDEIKVDEEKQAVIVQGLNDPDAPSDAIEVDAEPIKLLAQLYAKHLQNEEIGEPIKRPAGFYPNNIPDTYKAFDLFRRSQKDSVVITNPEYIDLRAFLLTNRFRSGYPELVVQPEEKLNDKSQNKHVQAAQVSLDATQQTQTKDELISSQVEPTDDLTAQEEKPSQLSAPVSYTIPQELYNAYFNLPIDSPVILTRDALDKLPTSLKIAAVKLPAFDGQHDAQVAPHQLTFPYNSYGKLASSSFIPFSYPNAYYPQYPIIFY